MSLDLVDRIFYLFSKGNLEALNRFNNWIQESEKNNYNETVLEDDSYFWKVISSKEFNDLIEEDSVTWLFIFSKDRNFKALAKIRKSFHKNLIEEHLSDDITSIWILKSNFDGLKVESSPVLIFTPHFFENKIEKWDYEVKVLIKKLRSSKTKITEFILDKKSKEKTRRIR